jgi:GxxExxY protein
MLKPNPASHAIIGAALTVHSLLGPGVLESVYETCLCDEMEKRKLFVERQVRLPVRYDGKTLPAFYRVDFIVEKCVVVEVKCVEKLLPVHTAQLLSYLKLSGLKLGLLLNFKVVHLKDGIKRVINGAESEL